MRLYQSHEMSGKYSKNYSLPLKIFKKVKYKVGKCMQKVSQQNSIYTHDGATPGDG